MAMGSEQRELESREGSNIEPDHECYWLLLLPLSYLQTLYHKRRGQYQCLTLCTPGRHDESLARRERARSSNGCFQSVERQVEPKGSLPESPLVGRRNRTQRNGSFARCASADPNSDCVVPQTLCPLGDIRIGKSQVETARHSGRSSELLELHRPGSDLCSSSEDEHSLHRI